MPDKVASHGQQIRRLTPSFNIKTKTLSSILTMKLKVFKCSNQPRRPSLISLARLRDYDRIFDLLVEEYSEELFEEVTGGDHLVLHEILQFRPSELVVNLLLQRMGQFFINIPVTEEIIDAEGRNPLHIAMKEMVGPNVTLRLLAGVTGNMPSMVKDRYNRLPLHYACMNISRIAEVVVYQNIRILLQAYPSGVTVKDDDNETPFSLAIENGASMKVLDLLLRTMRGLGIKGVTQKNISEGSLELTQTSTSNSAGNSLPGEICVLEDGSEGSKGSDDLDLSFTYKDNLSFEVSQSIDDYRDLAETLDNFMKQFDSESEASSSSASTHAYDDQSFELDKTEDSETFRKHFFV